MSNPRNSGILLLLGAVLVFGGINNNLLAPEFFPLGLIMAPSSLYFFLRGKRPVADKSEKRAKGAVTPRSGSVTAEAFAAQQARHIREHGDVDSSLRTPQAEGRSETVVEVQEVNRGRVALALVSDPEPSDLPQSESGPSASDGSGDDDSWVSTDVSFPVEVQERSKLADEIRKLQRLLEDGIIDPQEFAAAKAKLLS